MTKYENIPEAGLRSVRHEADGVPRTSSQTLTRVDLAEAVYRSVGLSRKELAILVQTVLDELGEALIAGETVKLSSFGRFVVREKPERVGRNPKTGLSVPITQRRVLSFKPSSVLKARINGIAVPDEDA